MRKLREFLPDILALVMLTILGAVVLNGLQDRVDIQLTDDTGYLTLGLNFPKRILAPFGPAYSFVFKVLKQIFEDPIQLYYAVFSIMSVLPALCTYIFLRTMDVNRGYAFVAAALLLFSGINMSFFTWSRISHFAISLILLWAALMTRIREPFQVLFSLCFFSFFLGYVRPEFHISWYISSILLLLWWVVIRRFRITSKEAIWMIPAAFLMIALTLVLNPMSGDRSYTAFAQQFAYNYCEWNGLNHYDWIQWEDIAKKEFGQFTTLGEAYGNNPETFQKHVIYNIQQYFIKAFAMVKGIFFPESIVKIHNTFAWLIIGVLLFVRIIVVGPGSWIRQIWRIVKKDFALIIGILILAAPSVAASITLYSREHYLVLQVPLLMLIIALILAPESASITRFPSWTSKSVVPILGAFFLLIAPGLEDYTTTDVWDTYTYPSNKNTILALRKMNFKDKVQELDHEGGLFIYVNKNLKNKNYKWVNPFRREDNADFKSYITKENINMVYVTKALMSNRLFRDDPDFQQFIAHPELYGFKKVTLGKENKGFLLIKNDLK